MAQNFRIQLFMDERLYHNVVEAANTRKITFQNDSELMRKVLYDYTEKIADLVIAAISHEDKMKKLREDAQKKDAIIDQLRSELGKTAMAYDDLQENVKRNVKK